MLFLCPVGCLSLAFLNQDSQQGRDLETSGCNKKNLIGPILFLYHEESLASSNLNSKLLRFHCTHPNLRTLFHKSSHYQWHCYQGYHQNNQSHSPQSLESLLLVPDKGFQLCYDSGYRISWYHYRRSPVLQKKYFQKIVYFQTFLKTCNKIFFKTSEDYVYKYLSGLAPPIIIPRNMIPEIKTQQKTFIRNQKKSPQSLESLLLVPDKSFQLCYDFEYRISWYHYRRSPVLNFFFQSF